MKKKILIIIGLMAILIPLKGFALSGSINLSCNSNSITINSSTNCTLSGYSNEGVSALSAKLSASGNISISNISTSAIWQGNSDGGNIDLYTDNNKSGNFSIVTFTIKASSVEGTGSININNINFSDSAFMEHSIYGKSLTITVKGIQKPNVNTKPTQNNTKPNSNKEQTTIKPDEKVKSSDATLKSIKLNNKDINFSSQITDYNVEVSNFEEKITITAEATDSKSQVILPKDLNLKIGKNVFEIKVIAEDGTEKIYKLNITRLEKTLSNNSNLKKLEIEGYKISFSSNNYIYNLNSVKSSSLNIKAIAEDESAKVEVYGKDNVGNKDVVIVKVTAEDGTISEYIIYIQKAKTSNINMSLVLVFILFLISLIFNIFFIIKNKKIKLNNNI